MHESGEPSPEAATPSSASPPFSGLLTELAQMGRAIKHLFSAQMELLAAEVGLARSAIPWIMVAALAATISGVGLGLTLLGLVGVALAHWFGSWIWALAALSVLQLVFLLAAIGLFRRCMHWLSFRATRDQWADMMRKSLHKAEHKVDAAVEAVRRRES